MIKKYDNIEDAYKDQFEVLKNLANRHLYRKEDAIDVVHNAFTKALEYVAKHKDKMPPVRISSYILYREVLIGCRRLNKYSIEVPSGLFRQDDNDYYNSPEHN